MDNKEFASILLSEATEILNEAGRNNHLRVLANKQDNVRAAKKTIEKRIASEPDKVEYYGKSPLKSKIDTLQLKRAARLLEAEDKKLAKEGKKYSNRVSKDLSDSLNDDHRMHTNTFEYEKDRKAKEQFMKDFGGKKPKNASLHERINKRTSQNESIAILLTEAALLLNEGARYREEMKNEHGSSSKIYGDIAAKYKKENNAFGYSMVRASGKDQMLKVKDELAEKSKNKKVSDIHNKINNKVAQNEAIDELLTEAYTILNNED